MREWDFEDFQLSEESNKDRITIADNTGVVWIHKKHLKDLIEVLKEIINE